MQPTSTAAFYRELLSQGLPDSVLAPHLLGA